MANEDDEQEKLNRRWDDQLQELRVMQTGAQLTAGFLLTLPFQQKFAELSGVDRTLYVALVLLAAVTVLLVVAPVAVHRRLSGEHAKERVVTVGSRCTVGALVCLALLVAGMVALIVHVVEGTPEAVVATVCVVALEISLLVVMPQVLWAREAK